MNLCPLAPLFSPNLLNFFMVLLLTIILVAFSTSLPQCLSITFILWPPTLHQFKHLYFFCLAPRLLNTIEINHIIVQTGAIKNPHSPTSVRPSVSSWSYFSSISQSRHSKLHQFLEDLNPRIALFFSTDNIVSYLTNKIKPLRYEQPLSLLLHFLFPLHVNIFFSQSAPSSSSSFPRE